MGCTTSLDVLSAENSADSVSLGRKFVVDQNIKISSHIDSFENISMVGKINVYYKATYRFLHNEIENKKCQNFNCEIIGSRGINVGRTIY